MIKMKNKELFIQMKKYNSFKARLFFEVKSLIGRKLFFNRSKINNNRKNIYLDLGVGDNFSLSSNWIHVDFFSFRNPLKMIFKQGKNIKKAKVECDLRYQLLCAEKSIEGVFSCHTLEHLLPSDAIGLIEEVLRILKPGKWTRIVIPDIKIYVEYYNGMHNNLNYDTGCEALMGYTQNWGHISSWDEEFLTKVLKQIGFVNIKKVLYGVEGTDKQLIKEPDNHKNQSLVIEAQKPIEY